MTTRRRGLLPLVVLVALLLLFAVLLRTQCFKSSIAHVEFVVLYSTHMDHIGPEMTRHGIGATYYHWHAGVANCSQPVTRAQARANVLRHMARSSKLPYVALIAENAVLPPGFARQLACALADPVDILSLGGESAVFRRAALGAKRPSWRLRRLITAAPLVLVAETRC